MAEANWILISANRLAKLTRPASISLVFTSNDHLSQTRGSKFREKRRSTRRVLSISPAHVAGRYFSILHNSGCSSKSLSGAIEGAFWANSSQAIPDMDLPCSCILCLFRLYFSGRYASLSQLFEGVATGFAEGSHHLLDESFSIIFPNRHRDFRW